ncbi:MAG: hypothetical protein MR006_07765 [Arcanobacterium sp.]|nr:hypothetical protein [Arcanobacterium sp.]MDY5589865.1 hypothetical protein [Arcanobacterium sp.]
MNTNTPVAGRRIADRFELATPFADSYERYGVSTWKAIDTVLSQELRAVVIPHDHPHRALAIDAARKAGLFEDPHAAAVLFVVDDDSASAFFTEFPIGTSLDRSLTGAPLPPEVVTAIIGETTSVINHARHQGLRHLQLQASHIFISDSGELMLDGVATMAGLAGAHTESLSTELDRAETRGLLVFYAALLAGKDFPEDPDSHQSLIESTAQRSDLPDRLRDVFHSEAIGFGPQSPADLLRKIVPWGDIDVALLPNFHQPAEISQLGGSLAPGASSPALVPQWPDPAQNSQASDGNSGETDLEVREDPHQSDDDDEAGSSAGTNEGAQNTEEMDLEGATEANLEEPDPEAAHEADSVHEISPEPDAVDAIESDIAEPDASNPENLDSALALPSYTVHAPPADSLDSQAVPDSQATPEHSQAASGADSTSAASTSLSASLGEMAEANEEAPLESSRRFGELPSEAIVSTGSSSIRVSTAVIALFAVGVFIALILGMIRLFAPLDPVKVAPPDSTTGSSQNQKAPAGNGGSAARSEAATPPSAPLPQIESASFISADPAIKDVASAARLFADAPKVADGNPSTVFQSWFFNNPELSATDQFGLLIKLKEPASLTSVSLTTASKGGQIQWRAYNQANPAGGTVITQAEVSETTTLTAPQKVSTDSVLIWVTRMPKDSSGENRIRISEVSVK